MYRKTRDTGTEAVALCRRRDLGEKSRWSAIVLYAAAMAFVEAAVVVYLRVLINRIEPNQPDPLPVSAGLGQIELVRELQRSS